MNTIYKYIVNFICLFITKEKRRRKREKYLLLPKIVKKNIQTSSNLKHFVKKEIKEKTVLIVEPNPYHFELLPGFVNYFYDLGYTIEIIAQPEMEKDSPFIYCSKSPIIFYLSVKNQKKALQSQKIKLYDFVFLSTSVIWADNLRESYINWLGFEPKGKYGFFMIEHNLFPYLKEYGHEKYISQNNIFTLAGQHYTNMLNPHYFGEFNEKSKSTKTKFVVIVNDKKNAELIFSTCQQLLSKNISNFEITIAGRSFVTSIPNELKSHIKATGKVSFEELWKIYNQSDFFIPLLNLEIGGHHRYKNGTITGTWQSILGFKKPCLIHKDFSDYYLLTIENSIIYNSNNKLFDAIVHAINMDRISYINIQKNVKSLSRAIYNKSLYNLTKAINFHQNLYK